ncbi:MAG: hypothetical protein Fur0019_00200 [Tibeticola sp.]
MNATPFIAQRVAAAASAVASLCLCATAIAQDAGASAAAPRLAVGDSLSYRVEERADNQRHEATATVIAIDGDRVRMRYQRTDAAADPTEQVMTTALNNVVNGSDGSRYEPHLDQLRFPLQLGQAWTTEAASTTASGAQSRLSIDRKVVAIETVRVPAGEFSAYRVESKGWINGVNWHGAALRLEQVLWYAPAPGRIVKLESRIWRNNDPFRHTVVEALGFQSK